MQPQHRPLFTAAKPSWKLVPSENIGSITIFPAWSMYPTLYRVLLFPCLTKIGNRSSGDMSSYFPPTPIYAPSKSANCASICQNLVASVGGGLGFGWLLKDRRRGGDAIAFVEAQQADALRGAAGFANFRRVHANHFALSGDDHHVGVLFHLQRSDHRAVAVGGFQIDDAFAAARRDAIFRERSAFAVAFFRDGEHERRERFADLVAFEFIEILRLLLEFLFDDFKIRLHGVHGDNVIVLAEVHAVDAGGLAAHSADFGFAEENGLAVMAGEENHLLAVGEFRPDEFIVRVEIDGDDAAGAGIGKFGERGFLHRTMLGGEENVAALFLEIARGDNGGELFAFLKMDEIVDSLAARGRRS